MDDIREQLLEREVRDLRAKLSRLIACFEVRAEDYEMMRERCWDVWLQLYNNFLDKDHIWASECSRDAFDNWYNEKYDDSETGG